MKYYVVIDTNVLVSAALKGDSNPGLILRMVDEGIILPLINKQIISEYVNVLKRPKFHFNDDLIDSIIEMIKKNAITIDEERLDIFLPDEKDRVFYEVVIKSNKERESKLVTGNIKHFPIAHFIVTPKELCDLILADLENVNITLEG